MKILITNCHLTIPHGSEIWTNAVAQELAMRRNEVFLFSPEIGDFHDKMLRNITTISNPGSWQYRVPEEHEIERDENGDITYQPKDPELFDIAIIQHLNLIKDDVLFQEAIFNVLPPSKKIILVSHGTDPSAEQPVPRTGLLENAHYVCISEEIAKHYAGFPWEIVKQPILNAWFEIPVKEPVQNPTSVLWASHRHSMPEKFMNYCLDKQIGVFAVGHKVQYPPEIRDIYAKVDLVVGKGRWIYEGLAAGIPCIVADSRSDLGYVSLENVQDYEKFNMTTRHPKAIPSSWEILFENYHTDQVEGLKKYAKQNYRVSVIVDNLMTILGVESVGEITKQVFS